MSCFRSPKSSTPNVPNNVTEQACPAQFELADGFVSCCDRAHAAQCLLNHLCYQSYWKRDDGSATGFLVASCTDDSFQSGACNRHCINQPNPDVVYNETSGLWHCCGETKDGGPNCNHPTTETFQARKPNVLLGEPDTSTNSTSSRSPTASRTASSLGSSSTAIPATSGGGSSGLSTGAKAGIGIGAALGVLLVIAFIAFLIMRRRKKSKKVELAAHPPRYADETKYKDARKPVAELSNDYRSPLEMDASRAHTSTTRSELPG